MSKDEKLEYIHTQLLEMIDDNSFIDDLGDTKEKLKDMLFVIEEVLEPFIHEDSEEVAWILKNFTIS